MRNEAESIGLIPPEWNPATIPMIHLLYFTGCLNRWPLLMDQLGSKQAGSTCADSSTDRNDREVDKRDGTVPCL